MPEKLHGSATSPQIKQLSDEVFANCEAFTCGNADLDDFFMNDAKRYADELMGKTYCWITDAKPHKIVALFTLANDSIKTTYLDNSTRNRINLRLTISREDVVILRL